METDSFFYQLLQKLPETLFDLLGLPSQQAAAYRFDSVELKKSLRIDGLFVPKRAGMPLFFVEVQFQRRPTFYANLFAKVFLYLEAHDPNQDWVAVALFPSKAAEPIEIRPYNELLNSNRVRRFYLDELKVTTGSTLGLQIMSLVSSSEHDTPQFVGQLVRQAHKEPNSERARKVIELVEEVLIRRFTQLSPEEIRTMFQLHDLRKTRFWQEAHEEGREEGREEGKTLALLEIVQRKLSKGKSIREIADQLEISQAEVRRLAKHTGN